MDYNSSVSLSDSRNLKACHNNKCSKLVSMFVDVCEYLEFQAENQKRSIDSQAEKISLETARLVEEVTSLTGRLSDVCNKITLSNMPYEEQHFSGEHIEIPYCMQSGIVNSIREVYLSLIPEEHDKAAKLIPASYKKTASDIIRTIDSNMCEIGDF